MIQQYPELGPGFDAVHKEQQLLGSKVLVLVLALIRFGNLHLQYDFE